MPLLSEEDLATVPDNTYTEHFCEVWTVVLRYVSGILIHPAIWRQYTNVIRQTDRQTTVR